MISTNQAVKPTVKLRPPKVKGWPLLGPLPTIIKDIYQFLLEAQERYGDVYTIDLGLLDIMVFNHPRHVEHIFVSHFRNYRKGGPMWDSIRDLTGNGIVTSEGDFWRKQRRMMQPQFHRKRIAGLADLMVEAIDESLPHWDEMAEAGQAMDMALEFPRMTMQVIVKTMFGTAVSTAEADRVGDALTFALDYILQSLVTKSLPAWIPVPGRRRYQEAVAEIDEIVMAVIERRRQSSEPGDDLLTMLLQLVDEETGEGMTNQQLRDEAVTLFLAGYETTATALMWLFNTLPGQPDVVAKLRQEIDQVLVGRTPTLTDLPKLSYTHMVLQESLRLYPPAWWLMRTAVEDDEIDGFHIPAGTLVMPMPYTVHRHPEIWDDPEAFIPERFAPDQVAKRHKFAWTPFGAGQRLCIGRDFALMEGQLILARILQRYRLEAVPGHEARKQLSTTLRSKDGIFIRLSPTQPTT